MVTFISTSAQIRYGVPFLELKFTKFLYEKYDL
jgi:hypothetical protein